MIEIGMPRWFLVLLKDLAQKYHILSSLTRELQGLFDI